MSSEATMSSVAQSASGSSTPHVARPGTLVARGAGNRFLGGPLPPADRLADVRSKLAAGEVTRASAAAMLDRSCDWLRYHVKKNHWVVVPFRKGAPPTVAAKPPRRRVKIDGPGTLGRAAQAAWRAIGLLTDGLEKMIAENADADAVSRQTTAINKLVADTRRNGLHDGAPALTGDANDHASAAADDTADTAENLARARADMAARLLAGFAVVADQRAPEGHEPGEPAPAGSDLGDAGAA